MIARMPPAQLALAGLCGALTLTLAYEIAAPIPPFEVAKSGEIYRPAAITFQDAANTPPAESFGDIDAHPIFSSSRTPVASHYAIGGGATSAFPTDVTLIGVIIEGKTRMALVKTGSEPFARSVPQGGEVEGWTVTEVDPDKIVLSSGVKKQEILLAANRGPDSSGLSVNPGASPNSAPGAGTTVAPPPGAGTTTVPALPTPPPNPQPAITKPAPDASPPAPHQ